MRKHKLDKTSDTKHAPELASQKPWKMIMYVKKQDDRRCGAQQHQAPVTIASLADQTEVGFLSVGKCREHPASL